MNKGQITALSAAILTTPAAIASQVVTVEQHGAPVNAASFEDRTAPLNLRLVKVPGNGKEITDFQLGETEISNEQYVHFLNEAFSLGLIAVNEGMVFDRNGDPMLWMDGSRVVKDHNRDGVYTKEEMENPLNRCFIEFDNKSKQFRVVDPAAVDWNQYFDTKRYPNVKDSIDDWAELNPAKTGWHGEGDKDKKLPSVDEVKTWPVNFIRYYGSRAFAEFYGYSVPTKAQWQYAGKGGKNFTHATSDGTGDRDIAWINVDGPGKLHRGHVQPVKSKKPNPYGLYNMGGNVWEWVDDWFRGTQVFFSEKKDADYFIDASVTSEQANGKYLKGILGGSFNFFPRTMRVDWNHAAKAGAGNDHFGARVARPVGETPTSTRELTIQAFDKNQDGKLGQKELEALVDATYAHFAQHEDKMVREAKRAKTNRGGQGKQRGDQRRPGNRPSGQRPEGGPPQGERPGQGARNPAAMFSRFDANKDGKISADEMPEPIKDRLLRADKDGDGAVTEAELEELQGRRPAPTN